MSFEQLAKKGGEFQYCIIKAMDDQFQQQMERMVPVRETPSIPPKEAEINVSYAFQNDSSVLQITESDGQFKIHGELVELNQLKEHIKTKDLSKTYSSVALIISDATDTGLFVSAMDDLKQVGFNHISIARKEKLQQYQH